MIAALAALPQAVKLWSGVAVASALTITAAGCYWKGRMDEGNKRDLAAAVDVEKLNTRNTGAHGAAAVQAERDNAAVAANTEGLKHADDQVDDSSPSASRVALACERLRQQGADLSGVPACRGSQGRAQAGAQR
jgi:hypothetical protein